MGRQRGNERRERREEAEGRGKEGRGGAYSANKKIVSVPGCVRSLFFRIYVSVIK